MEQAKVGRFIAEARRAKGMTQRQLAEKLCVSDKAVSKWETGGVAGSFALLPLCAALEIGLNDLLSGERVSEGDYRRRAEENMVDLMKENQENRQRMALSIVAAA